MSSSFLRFQARCEHVPVSVSRRMLAWLLSRSPLLPQPCWRAGGNAVGVRLYSVRSDRHHRGARLEEILGEAGSRVWASLRINAGRTRRDRCRWPAPRGELPQSTRGLLHHLPALAVRGSSPVARVAPFLLLPSQFPTRAAARYTISTLYASVRMLRSVGARRPGTPPGA